LSIKTKLIGGASALAIAGGMLAFAAPAANAAVTQIGSCQNLLALGSAKSTTINPASGKPYGITDGDNRDGALSAKGVDPTTLKGPNLGSCNFPVNVAQGVPNSDKPVGVWPNGSKSIVKWGTKLFSREFDCNIVDTSDTTEWSPSGTLSFTFTGTEPTSLKAPALTAQVTVDGFTDPDSNPATPSDVVGFHGLVIKGAALGSDVNGETEFDPTVKDKTAVYPPVPGDPNNGGYFGYKFDLGGALGCQDGPAGPFGPANILLFNNGSVGGQSQLLNAPVAGITFTKGTA
jgi:hypothetical protein